MTTSCPKCRRPARPSARRCLYCGSELGPGGDGLSTTVAELPPVAAVDDGPDSGDAEWMVMITPPAGDPEPLVTTVARLLQADPYIVRLRLRRGKPFLGAGSLVLTDAQGVREGLARLGVAASVFSEAMLAAVPDPLDAVRGALREGDLLLEGRGGEVIELPYEAIFLVVQGEVSERKRRVTTRDLHAAQANSSFDRVEQKVKEVSHERRLRLVVDIYHTLAPGAVRLHEDLFRVADAPGVAARGNVLQFVEELRRLAPNEVFDGSFGELDAVNAVVKSHRRDSPGTGTRETTVEDNEAELDAYSQALFLHVLKLRRAAP